MSNLKGLEKVLNHIKDRSIVCPKPQYWNELFKRLDGYNENWKNDGERLECYPLILGNWWDTEDDHKHLNFINSIKYFYKKYPDRRKKIEIFVFKLDHDNWYFGDSPDGRIKEKS